MARSSFLPNPQSIPESATSLFRALGEMDSRLHEGFQVLLPETGNPLAGLPGAEPYAGQQSFAHQAVNGALADC